jgi:hypothetical protein
MISIEQLINAKHCEDVFINDMNETRKLYKELAKKYHPDVNKDEKAEIAFRNLQTLYQEAKEKLEKGIWEMKNLIILKSTTGKKISFKYLSDKQFELGHIYVGNQHILYSFEDKNKKYFDNAILMIKSIKYANSNMRNEFEKLMPKITSFFSTDDNKHILVIEKNEKEYMLSDVVNKTGSKLTDRHVAWIISRLNNLNCFLTFNNIVLNGINTDNCFINPENHTLSLYGGWWYAKPTNKKMIGTTGEIFSVMPIKNKTEKIALHTTDMESIRYLAKKILFNKATTPKALLNWLEEGSEEDSFKEFEKWNTTLDNAYGKRTFVNLNISKNDIYE